MRNLFSFSCIQRRAAMLLLPLLLGTWAARAQCNFDVKLTPAGPLTLCAGGSTTLTAAALTSAFNAGGRGFSGLNGIGFVNAIVVQPDGKVLVGGEFTSYNGDDVPDRLIRLNADGSRDMTFNGSNSGFDDIVVEVALARDGKVLVGGEFRTYNGASAGRLIRLNADGSRDETFNANSSGFDNDVEALVLEPDGQVLVGGRFLTYNGVNCPDFLVRLNANGSRDTDFNGSNVGFNNFVFTLALQPDGKVLAGGEFGGYNGAAVPRGLVRLNANGSRDTGFNGSNAGFNNFVYALALEPDGQVLVGGGFFTTYNGANVPNCLIRLHADGSRDVGFNGSNAGFNGSVYALALQPDGKVLAGGFFSSYNQVAGSRLVRLNADGSRDPGFNGSNAGFGGESVVALALEPDRQVLAGGGFTTYNEANVPDHLIRLNPDGSRADAAVTPPGVTYAWSNGTTGPTLNVTAPGDYQVTATSAGCVAYSNTVRVSAAPAVTVSITPAGPVALPTGASQLLTATATTAGFNVGGSGFDGGLQVVLVLPDGKVLVGGRFTQYNGVDCPDQLVRLNADGSLDRSFNSGGVGFDDGVYALALEPDGQVLVGGLFLNYNGAAARGLVRLNNNGTRDTGFNTSTNFNGLIYALALEPDGDVLVGGGFSFYSGGVLLATGLVRLNADGSVKTGFNGAGSGFDGGSVRTLVLEADGQVVAGGFFQAYNGVPVGRMMRFNADGTRDTGFNSGGTGFNQVVVASLVQPDGKILLGGQFTTYNGDVVGAMVRLNSDGTRDTNFNSGGGSGFNLNVNSFALEPDGQILVGGVIDRYNGNATAPNGVARLNSDGTLDTNFNSGGTGFNNSINSLALTPDGKITVGGYFTGYNNDPAVPNGITRLNADGSRADVASPVADATFVFNPVNTTGNTRTVSEAGAYTATATDPATGCTYTSNTVSVTVTNGLATAPALSGASVVMYPNPVGPESSVSIVLPVAAGVQEVRATVLNTLGQVVRTTQLAVRAGQASGALATGGLAKGVYIVQLQAGGALVSKRLVIQ